MCEVFAYLNLRDLYHASFVSKGWRAAALLPSLWTRHAVRPAVAYGYSMFSGEVDEPTREEERLGMRNSLVRRTRDAITTLEREWLGGYTGPMGRREGELHSDLWKIVMTYATDVSRDPPPYVFSSDVGRATSVGDRSPPPSPPS